MNPPDDIRVYLNTASAPAGLPLPGQPILLPAHRFWTIRKLAAEMRRNPPDVLFIPSYVIPPIHPASVVTIHDLGYLIEPDCHDPGHRKQLEWSTRWNIQAATGIIAISETTRNDLIEHLQVDPARIEVIHHGVANRFQRATTTEINFVRLRYGIGSRAILAVGTIHPRKNLIRLIQAFEQLANEDRALQLVLCGGLGWQGEQILQRARTSPFAERILHLGFAPDSEMPALYSTAAVVALPSLYEGFGMPLLESMACGTPVVAANRAALPEIAGGAALLVDPLDSAAIAGGIERIINTEETRRTMTSRGLERVESFSWNESARQTLAFLRSVGDNVRLKGTAMSKRGMQ